MWPAVSNRKSDYFRVGLQVFNSELVISRNPHDLGKAKPTLLSSHQSRISIHEETEVAAMASRPRKVLSLLYFQSMRQQSQGINVLVDFEQCNRCNCL